MNKFLLPIIFIVATLANAANAQSPSKTTKPETPMLRKDDYRQKLDEVIVIGQDPYWRKGTPRWDRSKVDVDLKPETESRLQLFPNYTAEERDEALKPHDSNRNNSEPKIKLFDVKF